MRSNEFGPWLSSQEALARDKRRKADRMEREVARLRREAGDIERHMEDRQRAIGFGIEPLEA